MNPSIGHKASCTAYASAPVRAPICRSASQRAQTRVHQAVLPASRFGGVQISYGRSLAKPSRAARAVVCAAKPYKVALLGAAGGIGQPLALLLKMQPYVAELALYDIANVVGVAADLSHCNTPVKVIALLFHARYPQCIMQELSHNSLQCFPSTVASKSSSKPNSDAVAGFAGWSPCGGVKDI